MNICISVKTNVQNLAIGRRFSNWSGRNGETRRRLARYAELNRGERSRAGAPVKAARQPFRGPQTDI
ncbi:hypothetical protein MPLDJ20_140331 [Mesorhizobium plurifarium]|uniref:Uncharacterized protein n=1 Tax=Mesorhizobium plurifarium TaxID=69974 RepID=A0A090EL98_MESPL|nr:hypothetical protein MPLDJ20_140331 [Mesorhizobium plurifarium]